MPRQEVEQHFPTDKDGLNIFLDDWDDQRTWQMKLKASPHKRGARYVLCGTAEDSKLHSL